jgi:hypothetical protein
VSVVAAIRPDSWDFPLLLHVLGAMLLVGALVLTASALIFAWRNGNAALVRLGFRSLLIGVLPAWIVMRVSAEWVADKEGLNEEGVDLAWIDIGYMTADTGLLLIIVATVLGGLAARRAAGAEASGGGLRRASTVVVSLLLIASLVSVWAMTTKPT